MPGPMSGGEVQPKRYVAKLYAAFNEPGVALSAEVLRNTLGGTVVWTRSAQGRHSATLLNAFPVAKTIVTLGSEQFSNNYSDSAKFVTEIISANEIRLSTYDLNIPSDPAQVPTLLLMDNLIGSTPELGLTFMVEVYP